MINQPAIILEGKVASLFEPDTLVSAQYFDGQRRKTCLEPEKELMLAVLENAISCFQNNLGESGEKRKKLFQEAEEWIFDRNSRWPFSFENICGGLGLDPGYLRFGLIRWSQEKLRKDAGSCDLKRGEGWTPTAEFAPNLWLSLRTQVTQCWDVFHNHVLSNFRRHDRIGNHSRQRRTRRWLTRPPIPAHHAG